MSEIRKEALLTKAVFDYILLCVDAGDFSPLYDLGLAGIDIQKIQELYATDLLSMACSRANIIQIKFDRTRFYHLLAAMERERKKQQFVLELIAMGAPATMMQTLFALTPAQYSAARKNLNMQDGVGRTANVNEHDAHAAYNAFMALETTVEQLTLDQWQALLKATNLNLRELWNTIKPNLD